MNVSILDGEISTDHARLLRMADIVHKGPVLQGLSAKIWLLEQYEIVWSICNHDAASQSARRPFALSAYNANETVDAYAEFKQFAMRFADAKIAQVFGESLSEFMQRPHEECLLLMHLATKQSTAVESAIHNALGGAAGIKT